jgi:AcrR family transcriptional regulator
MAVIDRKKQVLNAAAQSFSLYGYKATTMDQVAKIANVGKGTIYTFFNNKEELFDEILHKVLQEMKTTAEREIRRDRTFFDNLYRVLDALLEFREDHELFVKLSQELRDVGTLQAKEALGKMEDLILGYLEQEVEHAVQQKEIKPCDAQIVAFLMLKFYVSLTTDWSRKHQPLTKEQIQTYMLLIFSEGLSAKG